MFDRLVDFFRGKKILILGFGREGKATYYFLRQNFPDQEIYIADQNTELLQQNPELNVDQKLTCFLGQSYLEHCTECDIVMKSPGISLKDVDVNTFRSKIKSQLELVLEFADFTTIGVTGTKGKSTTSSLLYQILQDQNIPSLLLGNIGTPIFEHLAELNPDLTVILEMSSHQLEYVEHSPHIAVLLNIYEEHLDYYRSFLDYATAKCNIFKYQTKNDFLIYNADDVMLQKLVQAPKSQVVRVSFDGEPAEVCLRGDKVYDGKEIIYDTATPRQLVGDCNLHNIIFALTVVKLLGLNMDKASQTVADFKTLKHRLEFIGEFGGVKYYDNTIGTVPMATIEAVKALGDVDTVIIGGMDRGVDQAPLVDFLQSSNVQNIICMSETGRKIVNLLSADRACFAESLDEAVQIAKARTRKGSICLLSPAAASYGEFKNFEEKGDHFQELVQTVAV